MASTETQARHVFHAPSTGWDRIHAWQEATGEPAFVWGRHSGAEDPRFFGDLKAAFVRWIEKTSSRRNITIYHDGMGADALGPLDPAGDKVIFLHHFYPRWERHFEWNLRCTGKILVGAPELIGMIRDRFGWIPERFIQAVPGPRISVLEGRDKRPALLPRRTGIWLHGKRWRPYGNRLRSIVDRWLPEVGELEIITEGGGPPRWARRDNIIWSAAMPLEFAFYRLFTWDSVLLLNDYALDAPWLLQALALDCFPLVPSGDSPARSGPWEEDSAPSLYSWGDAGAAIELLGQWRTARDGLLGDFQAWRDSVLRLHSTGPAFRTDWNSAIEALLAQNSPQLRFRKPLASWYPLGWYERVLRLRCGL